MKLKFIGTGAIASTRNSASVLIDDHILFDIPNGNVKAMIRQNVNIVDIDTLIISHTHADHCFDAPFLLWYKENFKKEGDKPFTRIITDKVTKETVQALIKVSHFDSAKRANKEFIDFSNFKSEKKLGNVYITSIPMEHEGIKYANGYIIRNDDVSIGLTGDTCYSEGIKILASRVDYLISDMSLSTGDKSHMGLDNMLDLIKENPKLKIIPVHMYDNTRIKAKELNIDNLIILEDGDELEL